MFAGVDPRGHFERRARARRLDGDAGIAPDNRGRDGVDERDPQGPLAGGIRGRLDGAAVAEKRCAGCDERDGRQRHAGHRRVAGEGTIAALSRRALSGTRHGIGGYAVRHFQPKRACTRHVRAWTLDALRRRFELCRFWLKGD